MIIDWIYHGKNSKQCYYQPNCLVCYIKTILFFLIGVIAIVRLKKADRDAKK